MIDQQISPAAAEQARMDLSLAAGMQERSNRPRLPFIAACVLLAVAAIYAISGLTARQSALAKLDRTRASSNDVIALVNKIKTLQKTLAERGLDPNPRIASELETLARLSNAQITGVVTDSTAPLTSSTGTINKLYKARFESQPPAAILQFLGAVFEDPQTKGVGLWSLEFSPGQPDQTTGEVGWNLNVDFVRSERPAKR